MQTLELEVGETHTLASGIRITVLSILHDVVRLQIDAPEDVLITVDDATA
jgi:sRNA-binding carbon storage regulator CsrA